MIWHKITDYIFEENYVQKDLENKKNRLRNDGKTSNDGDASTKTFVNY